MINFVFFGILFIFGVSIYSFWSFNMCHSSGSLVTAYHRSVPRKALLNTTKKLQVKYWWNWHQEQILLNNFMCKCIFIRCLLLNNCPLHCKYKFCHALQTHKLNSENWKSNKNKVLEDWHLDYFNHIWIVNNIGFQNNVSSCARPMTIASGWPTSGCPPFVSWCPIVRLSMKVVRTVSPDNQNVRTMVRGCTICRPVWQIVLLDESFS